VATGVLGHDELGVERRRQAVEAIREARMADELGKGVLEFAPVAVEESDPRFVDEDQDAQSAPPRLEQVIGESKASSRVRASIGCSVRGASAGKCGAAVSRRRDSCSRSASDC
jgi:hypothetical protein